ncbi:MAG: GTPase HflX [Bacillota bacterium]|nr:GTPase HflX [Bacillota bacterium]
MIGFTEDNRTIRADHYRAVLVGLQTGLAAEAERSMEELTRLAEAAGIEVLALMLQSRERPDGAAYLGKGKVEELAEMCAAMEADTVVVNDELSGIQYRNLENRLGVKVIDRTMLILDIFAGRAVSREGKLQVELAQLQYRLPRLHGYGKALSRLGGGIGTRGPGEKKLETDRRHIQSRMDEIKRELREARGSRQTRRARREKSGIPVAALVGYTNSGKSAIMNRILSSVEKEEKAVKEEDMLFATLDTFQRSIRLSSNHQFILTDTVGFVSKLPHTLVDAFKATLEEVVYADLLLHVVDAADPNREFQTEVTEQVLKELGAGEKDVLLVYNKTDLLEDDESGGEGNSPESRESAGTGERPENGGSGENDEGENVPAPLPGERLFEKGKIPGKNVVWVSARSGENMEELLELIKARLFADRRRVALLIPYHRGDLTSYLCEKYQAERLEYRPEAVYLEAELSPEDRRRLEPYLFRQAGE